MYDLFKVFGGIWLILIGIQHKTNYESTPTNDQQYIFVANHIAYLDAVITIL